MGILELVELVPWFAVLIVLEGNRMNMLKKIALAGTVVAFFCALLVIFWNQKKREGISIPQATQGFGELYVRPGWLCVGDTNVIHRSAGKLQHGDWAGLEFSVDRSKLYLPDACRVTVQPAIATNPLLADVYHTISNALDAVDTILRGKDYNVNKFGRDVWLISIDRSKGGIWRITPSAAKNGVRHIHFDKYEDDEFSLWNTVESFDLSFKDDQSIKYFETVSGPTSLRCRHDARDTHSFDIRWSRRISPTVSKVMMFDADGRLVGEKTVDDRSFPDPFL